jgi:hypothetical protein
VEDIAHVSIIGRAYYQNRKNEIFLCDKMSNGIDSAMRSAVCNGNDDRRVIIS